MEISSKAGNIFLTADANEALSDESSQEPPSLPSCSSEKEIQNQQDLILKTAMDNTINSQSEYEMATRSIPPIVDTTQSTSGALFAPLESCGYVSYPAGNATVQEKDESNFQRTTGTIKPLPSYQVPVFACPVSSPPALRSPTAFVTPQVNMFSWPNSVSPNGTQGCPGFYSNPSAPSGTFGHPTAFLYMPVFPAPAMSSSVNFSKPGTRHGLPSNSNSRKRKCEYECEYDGDTSDDDGCDCEDCQAFLLASDMSDDSDNANQEEDEDDINYSRCRCDHHPNNRHTSSRFPPFRSKLSRDISPPAGFLGKRDSGKSNSCSSLSLLSSLLQLSLPTKNPFLQARNSSFQLRGPYNRRKTPNNLKQVGTFCTDSDNDGQEMASDAEMVEEDDTNSISPQKYDAIKNTHSSTSTMTDPSPILNGHESMNEDKKDDAINLNETPAATLSSACPVITNNLTSVSLDHSSLIPGVSVPDKMIVKSQKSPQSATAATAAASLSLPNKENMDATKNVCGDDTEKIAPSPSHDEHAEDDSTGLQNTIDEQILQALRVALGVPDDVELEEYEVADDDDENENADDEDEDADALDLSESPDEPQDPRGCLALVGDVVLSYGKISSANGKVKGCIEGDVCRVVVGGFLVSASHITRDLGRLGYSLGFYLDDLEINSFILQVQDGLLRAYGRRNKVEICLRIEIGAPVQIEDVNVNHNKATNVVWTEIFF